MKNREIKFRAWDKKEKRMIDINFWDMDCETMAVNGNWDDCVTISDDERFEWQQFTGLHDSKGKEIYEGDILKWHFISKYSSDVISPIIFKNGSFGVEISLAPTMDEELIYIANQNSRLINFQEVIGNIYEDEGLLNNRTNKPRAYKKSRRTI